MIIVMKAGATEKQIAHVIERIENLGLRPHVSKGTERTIIGAIGDERVILTEQFGAIRGIDKIMPVLKPYKLASREFHPKDSVIKINGVRIGGKNLVVMAGPCAVENRKQIMETAEAVKKAVGSAFPVSKKERQAVVRGRDIESGLPKSIRLNETEIREALAPVVNQIVENISETIEETPPELMGDIMSQGLVLAGGGSLLRGIDKLIATELKMPVWVLDDPQTAVVRGCGRLLDDHMLLQKVKVAARRM